MGQPTADQMARSLSDLTKAAEEWKEAGQDLAAKQSLYGGHLGDGLSLGMFAPLGAVYQSACATMAQAAGDGGGILTDVGETLDAVRTAYELDEENNVHLTQGMW